MFTPYQNINRCTVKNIILPHVFVKLFCKVVSSCRCTSGNRLRACTTSSATTQTIQKSQMTTPYSKERYIFLFPQEWYLILFFLQNFSQFTLNRFAHGFTLVLKLTVQSKIANAEQMCEFALLADTTALIDIVVTAVQCGLTLPIPRVQKILGRWFDEPSVCHHLSHR